MSSTATEEREALRDVARRFLEREEAGPRAYLDDATGHSPALWRAIAELGWTGLIIPEEHGGAGSSFAEMAVVLQELGRRLTPVPFLASAVVAATALTLAGSEEQRRRYLPPLAAGELIGTLASTGPDGRFGREGTGVTVHEDGSSYVLDGTASFVPDAHVAGLIVVAARDVAGSISLFLVPTPADGVRVEVTPSVDQTRRLCDVSFDAVTVGKEGLLRGDEGGSTLEAVLDHGAAAIAADCLGGAERVLEMSVEYAGSRVQFGRPIGSFQAIKHRCADMLMLVERTRSAVDLAVDALSRSSGDVARWISIAKAVAADAYASVAGQGVQVHGGIGFTWEHDIHLYLKRAKLDQALYGDSRYHLNRLATALLDDEGIVALDP